VRVEVRRVQLLTYTARWPQHCRSVKVVPQRPGSSSSAWGCFSKLVGAPVLLMALGDGPLRDVGFQ
jgi:hypothetical protein